MAEPTDGEWSYIKGRILSGAGTARCVRIATLEPGLVDEQSEIDANGRLFAASKELLAACLGMQKTAEDILANDDPDGEDGLAAAAMLAAIAKARGTKVSRRLKSADNDQGIR